MQRFTAPKETLGALDAEAAASLILAAADVALVIDQDGVIRDLALGSEETARGWPAGLVGRRWSETVTVESRPKAAALLREADECGPSRWRHLNHPSAEGPDIPVLYAAVRVGKKGRIVAVGRDLRATATLQRRLVEAQQAMERDYSRLRHVETRYRLLFQMTSEAVLVVDAATQRVAEANPAAAQLLGGSAARLVGQPFPTGLDAEGAQAVQALLTAVRATGRPDEVMARLAPGKGGDRRGAELVAAASMFRQEGASLFLVRLTPADAEGGGPARAPSGTRARLLELAEGAPDGFVVTGPDGRIRAANAAFLELAQLANEAQALGESLDRWLGRPGVDLNVLLANLRQHGTVRLFATTLRGEHAAAAEIEVSGVSLPARDGEGPGPCFGFAIRNVGRRLAAEARGGRELPRSVEQLTELVGRVPLKDLVRETTDVIERLCIEAALEITGDNRASAAEILGLSRQSLYMKLRRYGLGDLGAEGEA